jgi:hypothetical protein
VVTLVLDKYGPLERYLIEELRARGLEVSYVNARSGRMAYSDDLGILLMDDVIKAMLLSPLFRQSINPEGAYLASVNRLHLYKVLMSRGLPTPRVHVAQSPEEVGNLVRELGPPVILATPTRFLNIDGKVMSWEGGKSAAEHRMYMDNPLASLNLIIPNPREVRECLVIGSESKCEGYGELATKVAEELGCLYCAITLGIYEEAVVMDVDPRIRLEDSGTRERFITMLLALVRK